ncbi:hypothetical protein RQP46_000726 [Phenoliferia psychrophenolica]
MSPLAPYLGARAHLSLSWLTQTFLAILLLAISLSLLLASIPYLVKDAKKVFTSACAGMEDAADVLVSLPRYMADGVNELNAASVNLVVHGTRDVLDFELLAIEEIALFIIDMYRSLFLCLLDLVVHGSLDVGVRTEVLAAITDINEALNATEKVINKLGTNIHTQISMPTLSSLENVTLPAGIVNGLTSLNASIPTLSELRASLDSIISTPITLLRSEVNSTMSNATILVAQLPVPDKETVDLCSTLDTGFIDDVGRTLATSIHILLGVLAAVTVLLFIGYYFWEKYRYNAVLAAVDRGRDLWRGDLANGAGADSALQTPHLLAFLSATQQPFVTRIVSWIASRFRLGQQWTTSLFWFANYICHPNALLFLALGLIGLIGVEIQLALVEGPIRDAARDQAAVGAGAFSSGLTSKIDAVMANSSAAYANSTNKIILGVQDGINNNLFGWVNVTTTAMNSTLNTFYDGLTDAITTMFNGTVLEDPALDLVYCLIGSKVKGVETALTFIHDHAHLDLPTVSSTLLTLAPARTAELTSSLTNPNSSTSTASVVDSLIDRYASSLRSQRLGFILMICIWGIVLLMGIFGVWWAHHGSDWWSRRRGRTRSPTFTAEKFDAYKLRAFELPLPRPSSGSAAHPATEPAYPSYPPFPPPPFESPRPDHPQPSYAAGASWSSLVEFFKPGHDNGPNSSSAAAAAPAPTPSPSLSPNPNPNPSRLQMRSLHLPSLSHSSGTGSGLRSRARRDSETIDLRTGNYLNRPLASNNTNRFRGAVGAVANAVRGLKPESSSKATAALSRDNSLTSLGPKTRREWDERSGMSEVEEETLVPDRPRPQQSQYQPSMLYFVLTSSARSDELSPCPLCEDQPHRVKKSS